MIWRSSFPLREHLVRGSLPALSVDDLGQVRQPSNAAMYAVKSAARRRYLPDGHFSTEARRLLFDSYAEWVARAHGFHVWDVSGLCMMGSYRWGDAAHADGLTSWTINLDMLDTLVCPAA